MRTYLWYLAFWAVHLGLTLAFALPAAAGDLAEEIRRANSSTIGSIHTFSCRVKVSSDPPSPLYPVTGEYWRALNDVRVKWRHGAGKPGLPDVDSLVHDGIMKSTTKQANGPVGGTVNKHEGRPFWMCDAWSYALFTLPMPESMLAFSLDDLLKQEGLSVNTAERDHMDQSYVVLRVAKRAAAVEVWFSRKRNLLAQKLTYTNTDSNHKYRSERVFQRLKEVAPAVFFPEEVVTRSFVDDTLSFTETAMLSDIRINPQLGPEIFRLEFPAGTTVIDGVEGKRYEVNAQGHPSKESSLSSSTPLSAAPLARTETRDEPLSWTRLILPGSIGLLVIVGVLWVVRRWSVMRFAQK